jgi:DNA-binding MarR family transcriptional regulator/GNAT superfamily N-acetyltransferase
MEQVDASRIDAVRAFNRGYTRAAGLITDRLLDTPHSLTEARVLYELGERELTLGELRELIDLDAGYTSRLVTRLESQGLLSKRRSDRDGRVQLVSLTDAGSRARSVLDRRSAEQVAALLEPVPEDRRDDLVAAMDTISAILGTDGEETRGGRVVLRPPGPGDLGWIVQRHGALYSREYGWDIGFEALVARVVAEYAEGSGDPRQAGWIAHAGGARAGSVLCVPDGDEAAKLRLLLVEPSARGMGIGRLLVDECVRFARSRAFRELRLWTNDVLTHARPIYEAAGFELVGAEPHRMFGPEVVGQDWRLRLA